MNKAELIERIIDTFTDMGSDDPADTATCNELTLTEAETYLKERRAMEKINLEPDEWLPAEVTPELYMEASNCYIRKCRHDYMKEEYMEWLQNVNPWDVYEEYCESIGSYAKVVPTEFLLENECFPFDDPDGDPNMLGLIIIGQNSKSFNPDHEYCWYNAEKKMIFSSDTPFADGIINAEEVAEWLVRDSDALNRINYRHADTVPNCWPWEN